MPFARETVKPVALRHGVGIAVMVTDPEVPAMHVGILFEASGGTKFLHLAIHERLLCDAAPPVPYHWSDCDWLGTGRYLGSEDHLLNVIEVAAERGDVAYGYVPPSDLYDGAGHLLTIAATEGVTCATFVALLFKAAGFPVVDLAGWRPRAEDAAGREGVLDYLRRRHPERYEIVRDQDVPFRLHPHEVATAAARTRIPTRFAEAELLSRPLYDALLPQGGAVLGPSGGVQPS